MAVTAERLRIEVEADTDAATRGLQGLEREGGKIPGWAKAAGAALAGAFAVDKIVGGVKAAISAASDLQQSVGGVGAVFGDSRGQIDTWAAGAAKSLGLSTNAYNEFATIVGSQLKNMGVPMDEVTGKTNDLITKGADLAATFGGTTSEAVEALSSLMRGETDPIERYGVSIKEADVQARLAAMGMTNLEGEAAKTARTTALLGLLTDQTTAAQGTFARESDTLAGQQQRLSAGFTNLVAIIGGAFLPVATQITSWASVVVDWFAARLPGALTTMTNAWNALVGLMQSGDFTSAFRDATGLEEDSPFVSVLLTIRQAVVDTVGEVQRGWAAMKAAFAEGGTDITSSGLAGVFEAIGLAARNFIEPVQSALGGLGTSLGPLIGQVAQVASSFSPLHVILEALTPVLPALGAALGQVAAVLAGTLGTALQSLLPALTQVAGALTGALSSAFQAIMPTITALLPVIANLISSLYGSLAPVLPAIADLLSSLAETLGGVLSGALSALLPPLMQVVAALAGAFVSALTALMPAITALLPIISSVAAVVGQVLVAAVTAVAPILTTVADLFTQLSPVISILVGVVGTLITALSPVIDAALGVVEALLPIVSVVGDLIGALLPPLVDLFMALLQPILALIDPLVGALQPILDLVSANMERMTGIISGAVIPIITTLASWFGSLVQAIIPVVQVVAGALIGAISSLISWVSRVVSAIVSFANDAISSFGRFASSASDKVGEVVTFLTELPGKVMGVFSDAGSWLVDSGKKIIQGLIDGVKNMASKVTDAVSNVLSSARDLLPFSPAKKGPFSGKGWTLYSGRSISSALAEGINDNAGDVVSATRALASAAAMNLPGPSVGAPSAYGAASAASSTSSSATPADALGVGSASGYGGPSTIVVVDADGNLIGRMRVEAGKVATGAVTPLDEGLPSW